MSGLVRAYRKYWPTEAYMKGTVILEDLMLCSFSTRDVVESWDVSTDQRWGGKSKASVTWQPWEPGQKKGTVDAQPWKLREGQPPKAAPLGLLQSERPPRGDEEDWAPPLAEGGFLRFSGELATNKTSAARSTGFCGARPPRRKQALLFPDGYEGLEMRIRTDGRTYELNFEPYSGVLSDLYLGYVRTPRGQWTTVALPMDRLILTGQGQVRDVQRKWDKGMGLRSVGVTVADGVAGPFQLDLAWISIVQKVEEAQTADDGQTPRKRPTRAEDGVMKW